MPEALNGVQLDHALALGWYRSNQKIFTCSHVDLNGIYRVHWLRYEIKRITSHDSHKRIRKRNKDFFFTITDFNPNQVSEEHRALHRQYRASINFDGATSIEDCLLGDAFNGRYIFTTKCISVFHKGKLIAGGYFDLGFKTVASILHYFDPTYSRFSLGKFMMLLTIDYMKENRYWHYYPGYLVQGLPKMHYKIFLGKECAEYFEPETMSWKPFDEKIMDGHAIDIDTFNNSFTGN